MNGRQLNGSLSNVEIFPKCLGAIDVKHCTIKKPPCPSSSSIQAEYCFTYIDIGENGRASDSVVSGDTTLNTAMESNSLRLTQIL